MCLVFSPGQWIANCVGEDNLPHFIAYVVNMCTVSAFGLYAIYALYHKVPAVFLREVCSASAYCNLIFTPLRQHMAETMARGLNVLFPWDVFSFPVNCVLFIALVVDATACLGCFMLTIRVFWNVLQDTTTLNRLVNSRDPSAARDTLPVSSSWVDNWMRVFRVWGCPCVPPSLAMTWSSQKSG